MNAPSREFLVQQAIMGAVWNEYRHVLRIHRGSAARALRYLDADDGSLIPGNLVVAITREFHKLSERWAA